MGTYLARPVTRKEREDGVGLAGHHWGAASMQGWRMSQEDAHIALPRFDSRRGLGLFGVLDGHGGGVVSALVAKRLPRELRLSPSLAAGDYAAALREALLATDRHLDSPEGRRAILAGANKVRLRLTSGLDIQGGLEESGLDPYEALDSLCSDNPDEMGCTAIVALLEHGPPARIHVANVGDSRCVLWDERGRAVPMSTDHKPRCKAERARVEAAGGFVTSEGRIEGNLNLSRALGDFRYKRTRRQQGPEEQMISAAPEVRSRELRPRDRFMLLGCDGVWETRRGSQRTVDVARQSLRAAARGSLSKALGRLFDATIARGDSPTGLGMDNMTAVLVELPTATRAERPRAASAPARATRGGVQRKALKRPAARGGAAAPRSLRKRPAAAGAAGRRRR